MSNYFLSRKFIFLLLALGITAVLIGLVVAVVSNHRSHDTVNSYQAPYSDQKQSVSQDQLPREMPSTIPVEANAKILENSNSTTSNNALQATRVFESKKSLVENYDLYEKFLTGNNWSIVTRINEPNNKVLAGRNGQSTLQISIDQDPQTKVVKVSLYYVQPIKSDN